MNIYKQFNQITRKYEDVKLSDVEIGSTVIKIFWSKNMKKFVTVPGESTQIVTAKGVAKPVLED
jgi:hypothetical protein